MTSQEKLDKQLMRERMEAAGTKKQEVYTRIRRLVRRSPELLAVVEDCGATPELYAFALCDSVGLPVIHKITEKDLLDRKDEARTFLSLAKALRDIHAAMTWIAAALSSPERARVFREMDSGGIGSMVHQIDKALFMLVTMASSSRRFYPLNAV